MLFLFTLSYPRQRGLFLSLTLVLPILYRVGEGLAWFMLLYKKEWILLSIKKNWCQNQNELEWSAVRLQAPKPQPKRGAWMNLQKSPLSRRVANCPWPPAAILFCRWIFRWSPNTALHALGGCPCSNLLPQRQKYQGSYPYRGTGHSSSGKNHFGPGTSWWQKRGDTLWSPDLGPCPVLNSVIPPRGFALTLKDRVY